PSGSTDGKSRYCRGPRSRRRCSGPGKQCFAPRSAASRAARYAAWASASNAGSPSMARYTSAVARPYVLMAWRSPPISPDRPFDVLVIGGGPAGMAAACTAAQSGRHIGILDDNPTQGGQIWRGQRGAPASPLAAYWFERFRQAALDHYPNTRVVGRLGNGWLLAETGGSCRTFAFDRLILATGARELFLPFPGWTLPQVMGA